MNENVIMVVGLGILAVIFLAYTLFRPVKEREKATENH